MKTPVANRFEAWGARGAYKHLGREARLAWVAERLAEGVPKVALAHMLGVTPEALRQWLLRNGA